MSVGAYCNREVVVIGTAESISTAAHLMRERHVGDLAVVEESGAGAKVPVGMVTDRDLVVELLGEDVAPEAVTVGDIMATDLLTAHEDDDVLEVVERMRERGVRRVPVTASDGGLVGILTVDDLLDLFAEQLDKMVQLIGREQRREMKTRR